MFRWFDRWMIKLINRAQQQAHRDTAARVAKEQGVAAASVAAAAALKKAMEQPGK